jgi:hypothetical protein
MAENLTINVNPSENLWVSIRELRNGFAEVRRIDSRIPKHLECAENGMLN